MITATRGVETLVKVDAAGVSYRDLNARLRELVRNGVRRVEISNVHGQRYIGTGLDAPVEINISGTPGNDLGAFMNGPKITVHGNAQDGCGNTMNEGEIVVHGHAGDTVGLAARGGRIFIREDVGYRAGIHMKEYNGKKPVIIIGGTAQDFAGEYMAGGVMVLLGLTLGQGLKHRARFIGTGMHGGVIYLKGNVEEYQLGKEVGIASLEEADVALLRSLVGDFAGFFGYNANELMGGEFIKLYPRFLRPYGRLYAY